jgi:SAM-dependent methyltransferase
VKPLEGVYDRRFSEADYARKAAIWKEIAAYLQRYVESDNVVLDIACDRGDFIRNVRAAEKWATDIRPGVAEHLPADVRFVHADGLALGDELPAEHFDVAFMSNYLEHLDSGAQVIEQLRVARGLLRPNGRVIVLQPNIRLVGDAYWDFVDHRVALTDRSLVEAAGIAGFETVEVVARFLPYTTKSRLPQLPRIVRAYLAFRPAWWLLGKQSLYVGRRV